MKANKIEHGHRRLAVLCGLVAFVAVAAGLVLGYGKLRELYLSQCVVTNLCEQVSIASGKMVHPDNIAEELGLRVGANLGTIDFADRREKLLALVPNLKSIRITRHLPGRITVVAEERTPVARLNVCGARGVSGRVVDAEGVVFVWQRGTQMLPTIREPRAPGTPKGRRIDGRARAALRLVEACRESELRELGVLEVDTSKRDFLVATLGNYSKVKILWEGMDGEQTAASRDDLAKRLRHLRDAIRTCGSADTVIWNATLPDSIFADTQGRL